MARKNTRTKMEYSREDVESYLGRITERQAEIEENIKISITSLHSKLDGHIQEENNEFKNIADKQSAMKDTITTVQDTLNTVSANGNRGLHASLKDLYNKNTQVHDEIVGLKIDIRSFRELVQPELDRKAWWVSTKKMLATSTLFKFIRSKFGGMVAVFFVWLFVNIVLHVFTNGAVNLGLEWLLRTIGYGTVH
jgi:hypothetical protein